MPNGGVTKDEVINSMPLLESPADSDTSVLLSSSVSSSPSSSAGVSSILKDSNGGNIASEFIDTFTNRVNPKNLSNSSDLLLKSYNEALLQNSCISMLPNFNIQPTGLEHGDFLVIDLGGSTLRVAVIQIDPNNTVEPTRIAVEKKWVVENNCKVIDLNFFKWLGSKIVETLKEQTVININSKFINTGLTWSFPLEQDSPNSGIIKHMGKGYTVSDEVYNRDLKEILEETLKTEYQVNMKIHVLINDSLAVYAAGTFLDRNMKLAVVLGTGFNICCSLKNSPLIHTKKNIPGESAMLFNCEASVFGSNLIQELANKYDSIIDYRFNSEVPLDFAPHMELGGIEKTICQPSELMTSGRYVPELARLVMCDLIESRSSTFFSGVPSIYLQDTIQISYEGFSGELMCFISENVDELAIINKIKQTYDWEDKEDITISYNDIYILKEIVDCVILRAAYIMAILIVGIIKLIKQHNGVESGNLNIGYVGSVLEYFKRYRLLILKFINNNEEIKEMNLTVGLRSVQNSSIVGAAVGAAYYSNDK
ncbi:N-acetylglucosamine kinase 1 [[Candida] railenensis]|uniref:Phosphotransferase n=1 Tax=[Candida] railenensis TaxID=45579 RepID=A0A9P0VXG3_9ASCO|nr:N-acetylglucosamine kinase 1 [[Candida] railenensis]